MKLTTKEITFLASTFEEVTPISLFSNINEALDETEQIRLEQKGVYKDGKLADATKEMFEIVAKAKKCTRIIMKDNFCVVEKYAYKVDDKIVIVENDRGEMLFSIPEKFEKAVSEISEFVGLCKLKSSDFEVLLTNEELLVLFGIIDIYRKNGMLSYIGQEEIEETVSVEEILKQLSEPIKNSMITMLKNNFSKGVLTTDAVIGILEKLVTKECLSFEDGYSLTIEYDIFAKSFLIPETTLMLDTLNIDDNNEIVISSCLCISAGIRDIVSFIFNKDDIEVSTLSGSQLVQLAENYLNCPDIF